MHISQNFNGKIDTKFQVNPVECEIERKVGWDLTAEYVFCFLKIHNKIDPMNKWQNTEKWLHGCPISFGTFLYFFRYLSFKTQIRKIK